MKRFLLVAALMGTSYITSAQSAATATTEAPVLSVHDIAEQANRDINILSFEEQADANHALKDFTALQYMVQQYLAQHFSEDTVAARGWKALAKLFGCPAFVFLLNPVPLPTTESTPASEAVEAFQA